MKVKRHTKLALNKNTVSNLGKSDLKDLLGGTSLPTNTLGDTCYCVPNTLNACPNSIDPCPDTDLCYTNRPAVCDRT